MEMDNAFYKKKYKILEPNYLFVCRHARHLLLHIMSYCHSHNNIYPRKPSNSSKVQVNTFHAVSGCLDTVSTDND